MQRTVKSTVFTYAVNEIDSEGKILARIEKIEIPETDEKRALKMAFKRVGFFAPLKTEVNEKLYILDDEIFFKYATVAEPKENGKTGE